jgi:N-acetylglucosaminyl-diphospho-decaprenol L-rhamnosyltransferase
MLLNPDTIVVRSALTTLVHFMDENPRAGACGARLLHSDGRFQHSAFAFPTLFQVFLDFFPINYRLTDSRLNGRYLRRLYQTGQPFPIDHPLGAALMVRREAIEQVELLDEQFFIYCEEIDWCLRIKAAGWGIWCVPEAQIVHHVARSTRQFRDEMFVALWKSRYQLFEKHYSRLFQWMARHIVRLGLWAEVQRARAAARRGVITESELTSRLMAYQRVAKMGQGVRR